MKEEKEREREGQREGREMPIHTAGIEREKKEYVCLMRK